ncbi:MAG TPA: MinD/ParA family protein [Syntrophales bacterium]|nr:MinD/ParA family protein [Syntrophales bacterium]HON24230.1 MinD/ParA family protein [Syntrophales bacterium]HOU78415.1 MinD/ParA family protein [Syntrophales bacterium]HPC33113.1 MinD/ParA family protein [Syntrophales bacterium]HQG35230.1 MinD/ParA family protein [Syntrophales bacterium]
MDQATTLRELVNNKTNDRSQMEMKRRDKRHRSIRVIAITSGKGGVGKTNIAVNLAYALAVMNRKVMVMDADMGLANIDLVLGLTPKYNLYHVLKGEKSLKDIIVKGPQGITVLPAASGIEEMADLSKGYKLTLLDELNALEERPDFMLVDTAAGIAGNVTYFNLAAKEIVVVTSPEPTSMTDAYALMKILFQGYARKRFRLIINMVKNQAEAMEVFHRLRHAMDHFLSLQIELLGYVVYDEKFKEVIKRQKALMELYPHSPAAKCLYNIAAKVCNETPEAVEEGSLVFFGNTGIYHGHG